MEQENILNDVEQDESNDEKNFCPIIMGELEDYLKKELLISLKASQLSILNQTFRPLMVAKLNRVEDEYAYFTAVNIKMQNAPEFVFPTPLMIPVNQIAWFMEFDRTIRFSIY